MTLVAVLLTFAIILWVYFLWSRRKYYEFALKMPGQFGFPLVGIFHRIYKVEEFLYKLPKLAAEYKTKTVFSWFGPFPVIYTAEPKNIEIVLNSADCIDKPFIYNVFHDLIGVGLLTSKSETWHARRKLLNPAFSHKVLVNFFPNFNKLSRELCDDLDKAVGCGEVDVKELTFTLAIKSALATTMGFDLPTDSYSETLEGIEILEHVAFSRILKPWLNISFIFKRTSIYKQFKKSRDIMMDFVHELVLRKIELFKEEDREVDNQKSNIMEESVDIKGENHIFIDRAIRLHLRNEIAADDIATEANIIIAAGTDTTANSLFAVLMYLAMFPEYQERVFEEIHTLFPDETFDVAYEDFKNLKFLDMCINETLRNAPGVPLIARVCRKDVPISKDLVIPKGTQVIIDIFNTHRDKNIWGPNADTFDPDHFLPENVAKRSSYAFLPFSKGPRICIGWRYGMMVLRVALVQVLQKYRFTTQHKFEDITYLANITLKYKTLPYLEVHKR